MTTPSPPKGAPRRSLSARDLALVATFAALIGALGLPGSVNIPGNPVPITLQSMGIMLAGSILGARRGALAVVTFLALVAAGLPLLSGGRGGLAVFASPSAGYLVGFVVGAFVIGWLVQRKLPKYPLWWGGLANVVGGMAVVYAIGVPVTAAALDVDVVAAAVQAAVYLPGDLIKVVIATSVAAAVHRAVPDLTPARQRKRESAQVR